MVTSGSPILAVRDIASALTYYTEVLGFGSAWSHGDPLSFGGVQWGAFGVLFNHLPELAERSEGQSLWVNVTEVDALYERHQQNGAEIVSAIEDKPWGRREYTVRDLNGYHLRFACLIPSSAGPSQAFPDEIRIERRHPTLAEHRAVAGVAFYNDQSLEGVLERTWRCVVAISEQGEVIGTVRIMFDAPGWFSIWDVAVLPEWQGRHIGQKLMEEALAIIREESPGAWVFLFTYKDGFYEKLGFGKESVTMRRV